MDDADQPDPEGIPADLAERIDAVRERAEQLAARVAEFSEDTRAPAGEPAPDVARSGPRRFAAWLFERRPPRAVAMDEALRVEPVIEADRRPRPAPISLAFDALAAAEGASPVEAASAPQRPVPESTAEPEPDPAEGAVVAGAALLDQEGVVVDMRPEGSVDQGKPADVEAEPATEPQPAAEPPAVREPPAVPEPAAVMSARNRRADIAPQPTAKVEPAADATDEAAEDDELVARPRPFAGAPAVYQKPAISAAASGRDPIADFFTRKDDDDEKKRWRRKKTDGAPAKVDKPQEKPAGKPAGKRKPWPKAARSAFRTLVVVAIAVAAALLLRAFVVEPYYVPSQSMEPTLHGCQGCNDDHVLVEKLSYLFHDPQPGDIVVFNRPSTWKVPDNVLIKRVIGVPGDDIRLQGGKVYRNGSRLDEPYVNQKCRHGTLPRNGSSKRKVYPPVPNGEVFVMGDNRCDSEDSRYFGVVPQSKIIGRAFLIIWPVGRIHSLS